MREQCILPGRSKRQEPEAGASLHELASPVPLWVRWLGKSVHHFDDFTHYHGKILKGKTWRARGLLWVIAWLSWWARHGLWSITQLATCVCIHNMKINGCWDSSLIILLIQSQRLWDCKTKGSSLLNETSGNISLTHPEMCYHGDSKSSHVDNED